MSVLFLGIDMAKDTFDLHILNHHKPKSSRSFTNCEKGFEAMAALLPEHDHINLAVEATSIYHLKLAEWAHEKDWTVFVLNPANASQYHQILSRSHKTDALDAWALAEYLRQCNHLLRPFTPQDPIWRQARLLNRRRETLIRQRVQETNRLETVFKSDRFMRASIKRMVRMLEKEVARVEKELARLLSEDEAMSSQVKLLRSIPAVGDVLSKTLTVELGAISQYKCAKDLTALVGLVPYERSSGTSVRGRKAQRRRGKAKVRAVLYMAAITAHRHPDWKDWVKERKSKGKTGMKLMVAIMDKLLRICFGVAKSGRDYDKKVAFAT